MTIYETEIAYILLRIDFFLIFCFFAYLLAQQLFIFVVATNSDTFIQRLWAFCESRHSCNMGVNDSCWFEFSILSCNIKSYRAITR